MPENSSWKQFNLNRGIDFALEGIKTALLLNGGASIALLAFLGSVADKEKSKFQVALFDIKLAIWYFGVGLLAANAVFILAYIAQLLFAEHAGRGRGPIIVGLAEFLRILAVVTIVASLVLFYKGVTAAAGAIVPAT